MRVPNRLSGCLVLAAGLLCSSNGAWANTYCWYATSGAYNFWNLKTEPLNPQYGNK